MTTTTKSNGPHITKLGQTYMVDRRRTENDGTEPRTGLTILYLIHCKPKEKRYDYDY